MTISYNWLRDYLPSIPSPEKLSEILTSIGLEVESLERFEEVKGGLEGLLVAEVLSCEPHPGADKLKLTKLNVGNGSELSVVCGASNVAVGQKVVLAPVGTTIFPTTGDPIRLKKAKIRGVESEGMICAEDEIGLGAGHDGILVLPPATPVGTPASEVFKPFTDHIYEIGLTPNRMDAMSHLGVCKDVSAWLSYHEKHEVRPDFPYPAGFVSEGKSATINVELMAPKACMRYSGIQIENITVTDSPTWLKQKLKCIGVKSINNIVDITNFILHETGQPLHAFDADKIKGNKVVVKFAEEGSLFKSLDEKERKLSGSDLVICDAEEPMCIAGVYGGANSGVTASTKNIFLESAWFDPATIRKTSVRHGLRTDAAGRFEKGTDISNTVLVLQRAALMIRDICGGNIPSDLIDVYPAPSQKTRVDLHFNYLTKLSGKQYPPADVNRILASLGVVVLESDADHVLVEIPFSKRDISIPADLVEEIMRIDGLDNVEIPRIISIAPSIGKNEEKVQRRESVVRHLVANGYSEIFTNSITNSAYYSEEQLHVSVKMINSLSAELNIMRPKMLQGGLQVIAHNLNRKQTDLQFFEFGKTYRTDNGRYVEQNHLAVYTTGNTNESHWKTKPGKSSFYSIKGVVECIARLCGIPAVHFETAESNELNPAINLYSGNKQLGIMGQVSPAQLKPFDIQLPVFYADIDWDAFLSIELPTLTYREISKFPAVHRDLALVVDKNVSYNEIERIALTGKSRELRGVRLFDVFESEKLGPGKKSVALSFTFLDESKTLTDKEIDSLMQKMIHSFEQRLGAEIRK